MRDTCVTGVQWGRGCGWLGGEAESRNRSVRGVTVRNRDGGKS